MLQSLRVVKYNGGGNVGTNTLPEFFTYKNKNMEWISVNDRLPENGQYVIAYGVIEREINGMDEYMTVQSGLYRLGKIVELPSDAYYCILKEITHWMPLPEPPKN